MRLQDKYIAYRCSFLEHLFYCPRKIFPLLAVHQYSLTFLPCAVVDKFQSYLAVCVSKTDCLRWSVFSNCLWFLIKAIFRRTERIERIKRNRWKVPCVPVESSFRGHGCTYSPGDHSHSTRRSATGPHVSRSGQPGWRSRSRRDGHGQGIFILATHPEGTWRWGPLRPESDSE